jgi:hypothetical protein
MTGTEFVSHRLNIEKTYPSRRHIRRRKTTPACKLALFDSNREHVRTHRKVTSLDPEDGTALGALSTKVDEG